MQNVNTYPTGQLIKAARVLAKIPQIKMAERLNMARQTYLFLENGQTDPRFTVIQQIAIITKQPLSFFYEPTPVESVESTRLVNSSRNQGIVFACRKLAELYGHVDIATDLISAIGITIECGREKDAEALRKLINLKQK